MDYGIPSRVRSRSDAQAQSPRGASRGWQIGPRIRIGGTLGHIGQDVKNAVGKGLTDTGHFLGEAASNPWVQSATAAALGLTGVGAPAAAAIMAAERGGGALLRPGGNIGSGLTGAATGAVEGYGAAKLGEGIRHLRSAFSGGDALTDAMGRGVPGVQFTPSSGVGSVVSGPGGAAIDLAQHGASAAGQSIGQRLGLSGLGNLANGAVHYLKDNATPLSMVGNGYLSMRQQGMENDRANAQMGLSRDQFAFQQKMYEDELKRRQAIAQALAGFFGPTLQGGYTPPHIAPNPYTTG